MRFLAEETLKPGDVLLYRGRGIFGWVIRIKTWADVSHCETYIGGGRSAASRDGKGVGTYPLRWTDLVYVYRPTVPFTLDKGIAWHAGVSGQSYDWLGLLIFFLAARGGHLDKMFCSEHTARMANKMGFKPFGEYDCDRIAPIMFRMTPHYELIWKADD